MGPLYKHYHHIRLPSSFNTQDVSVHFVCLATTRMSEVLYTLTEFV